jgi:hypothetical protein
MKNFLISFGSKGYEGTLNTLKQSAINYFDEVIIYNENDITELREKLPEHFNAGRGFGYWVWKPYLLLKTMKEKMVDNDTIFYIDSTTNFITSPEKILEITQNDDIVLFSSCYVNNGWTRYDTFYLMDCLGEKYVNGEHSHGAFMVFKKTKKSLSFLEEFLNNCSNYQIISDASNKYGVNFKEFKDHRHDQSILSLMAIKHGIQLHRDPSQWGENQKNLFTNSDYPTIIRHHRLKY